MARRSLAARMRALSLLFVLAALPAFADGTAAAEYRSGTLRIEAAAAEVSMQLRLPMTRAADPAANAQRLTPAEVVARLKSADKVFAFPAESRCQVESANAFAVDAQGRPTTADGNIQAMYRFKCEGGSAGKLGNLGVKMFEQIPGLDKLQSVVSTEKGERTVELTPAKADLPL